jgi:hypothetical protein
MHRLFAPDPIEKATQFEIVGRLLSMGQESHDATLCCSIPAASDRTYAAAERPLKL